MQVGLHWVLNEADFQNLPLLKTPQDIYKLTEAQSRAYFKFYMRFEDLEDDVETLQQAIWANVGLPSSKFSLSSAPDAVGS